MFRHHWRVNRDSVLLSPLRVFAAAVIALTPAAVYGQSGETDVGELAIHGGGTFGTGTHPAVAASTGIAFARRGMALLDVAYTPMGHDILWRRHDVQSPQNSQLFEFMFSSHIRFPVKARLAPYAIIGGGLLFNTFRGYTGPQGALVGIEDFKFGVQTGGGVRYYLGENWGIRPEFKVIVSSQTYTRMSIGVFYVVPPLWP